MLKEKEIYVCSEGLDDSPKWVKKLASGKGLDVNFKGKWCYNDQTIKYGDKFVLYEDGSVKFFKKPLED